MGIINSPIEQQHPGAYPDDKNYYFGRTAPDYSGISDKAMLDYVFDESKFLEYLENELAGKEYVDGTWRDLSENARPYKISERVRKRIISLVRCYLSQTVVLGDMDDYNTSHITYEFRKALREHIYLNFDEGGFDINTFDLIYHKIADAVEYMLTRPRDGAEKFKFLRPTHSSSEHKVLNYDNNDKGGFFGRLFNRGG